MGGAYYRPGNTTTHAEFNIYADPEAAARVATSGLPATWVGLDVTHQTLLTRAMWDELRDATAPAPVLAREVLRRTFEELGRPAFPMHDPLAVAVAETPALVGTEHGAVRIDVGELRRGETRIGPAYAADATGAVANHVNVAAFEALLRSVLE
jgi:purine nucleosidase